jgi:uncharacterized membrane protein YozB (DUF420 family)
VFLSSFLGLIALHAGIPLVVSQSTLTLMFVVLGIIVIGIGFGLIARSREGFLQHRWAMSVATALALSVIFLVMLPAPYNFYIDADLQFFSQLSILTLIHGVLGAPAVILGLTYAFGDLPQKTKRWMRWAALFWAISLILGVLLFLDMQDLLSFSAPM